MVRVAAIAAALVLAAAVLIQHSEARAAASLTARTRALPAAIASPPPQPGQSPAARRSAASPPPARVLAVPLLAQILNLSCEAASLQMALANLGRTVGQATLLDAMRPDYSRPVLQDGRVRLWSDPYDHFVGDPAGHEYDHTGYGVYYPVVARVAREEGAAVAWAGVGLSWEQLQDFVLAGHPVVVWIAYDGQAYGPSGPFYQYRADDGRVVSFGPGFEHTVTVAGVRPGSVLVNNPRWGHRDWLTRAEFEAAIEPFGRMAVVLG